MTFKLYVNRQPLYHPWGGGNNFTVALFRHAEKFDVEIVKPQDKTTEPDACLLLGIENDGKTGAPGLSSLAQYKMIRKSQLGRPLSLFLRCNENDARKNTLNVDRMWRKASGYVDGMIYVSKYLQEYFNNNEISNLEPNSDVIINGVDQEIFCKQDSFDNGKTNIVTHHWSNNELKGFDIYDKLDAWVGENSDKYTFTYIGRHRDSFKNTKIVAPLYGKRLGAELGKYDVYVSASRAEPGPNHVLESLACEIPTFVKRDGGGGVEFIDNNESFMYDDFDELIKKITAGSFDKPNRDLLIDWETCIEKYCTFIKKVHNHESSNT